MLMILLISSCSGSQELKKPGPSWKMVAGGTHGGIIENTDLDLIQPISPDAFSGATRVGVQAGVHYEYPLRRISLEAGMDYFVNSQVFTYQDDFPRFYGTRNLVTSQIRFPLAVNFRFFKRVQEDGLLQIRLGLSTGLVFYGLKDHGEQLPSYTSYLFSMGPLLGADLFPFHFESGSALGFSFELSRSFQKAYDDYYQVGEMPGASYLKFGLVYRLKRK